MEVSETRAKPLTPGKTGLVFLLLAVPLIATIFVRTADANIFGHDDRRLLTAADGLSAVGLVVCEGTTRRPTATLIATRAASKARRNDIIVTVAHAFLNARDERYARCAFWPGGHEADAARITFIMLGTAQPDSDWNADWAVALLDRKLDDRYQPLEPLIMFVREAEELRGRGAKFMLAGHNGEIGPLMVSDHCGPVHKENADLNRFDDRAFNHDCDMMPGWSGGPLMATINGRHYVVAVNATEMNALVTQAGEVYNGHYNANTAVRIDGPFFDAITGLTRVGSPERLMAGEVACRAWMPDPIEPKHC